MKIQPVKGTRDFYPQQMAVRNFIVDGWKDASVRNGFAEYDGPIFEYLKMYQVKSGDEIVEQLFNLTDRGGRDLAIRPEITPTLARMVNQQVNALPKPIRWFSVPRLCRAERPQKGRLREFFQWNVDIIGADDIRADAEIIFTSIDYLRSLGLTSTDVKARISSRKLLAALLLSVGIAESELDGMYALLDKKTKLPAETFEKLLNEKVEDAGVANKILEFVSADSVDKIKSTCENVAESIAEVKQLFQILELMGIADYCVFDMGIVRGLAYYTGIVFEVHDAVGQLRAICGGGRYDDLLKDFGGPAISATGMGMGDCVLEILLREKGLLKDDQMSRTVDYYIVCADKELEQKSVELTAKVRSAGKSAEFSYKVGKIGKLLKAASEAGAKNVIILGGEFLDSSKLVVKNMIDGQQKEITEKDFLKEI